MGAGQWLKSLFTGSNPTLSGDINKMGDLAGYSTGEGEKGTTAALDYDLGLLSGDPSKIAQTIAPETKMAQDQAQQSRNTVAQFGNRGGGMNAVMANLDDATRAKLLSWAGGARQNAAADAGKLGTANLSLAQNGTMDQAKLSQDQLQNLINSILGKATSTAVSSAETAGLGAAGL